MGQTRRVRPCGTALILALLFITAGRLAVAQDNYELQVFESRTEAPKTTMVEVLSNLIADGTKPLIYSPDQLYPTDDTLHETVEITQGITSWSAVSFYVFTNARSGGGFQWVGDHIRAQARAPESWHWPMGAALSAEFGYQRREYSTDTWTLRITPIVDKRLGRWYLAANPAFERSFDGLSVSQGFTFVPSLKASYAFNRHISAGVEYYADFGSVADISSFHYQQQQFFPTADVNLSADWVLSLGVGIGVTTNTDDWIWKVNVGRRFDWTRRRAGR